MRELNSEPVHTIVIDPAICNGKPIIRGTRITVQSIIEYLAAGDTIDDILKEFPQISRSDVEACLVYASKMLSNRFTLENSTP